MTHDKTIDLGAGTVAEITQRIVAASFGPGGTAGFDMAAMRARHMLEALIARLVELRAAGLPLGLEAIHDGLELIGLPGHPGYLDLAHAGGEPGTPAQRSMREVLAALPRAVESWTPGGAVPYPFYERYGLMAMPFRATLKAMLDSAGSRPS